MARSTYILILMIFVSYSRVQAEPGDTLKLTLQQVVEMAKARSIASKQAATVKETKYWEWKTYQSNYKPQLSLSGNLPGYSKTFREVLQPNGTIVFQPVKYNNSSLSLALSQSVAKTGGSLFAITQLQRFDDFDRSTVLYNGSPYAIGYSQPLLRFNQMNWDQKIEPIKYNQSRQLYIESLEEIAINASRYFFELLLAQVNLQIFQTNLLNTENILRIANLKLEMGKISRNEILQLNLEQVKAQKAVAIAKRDMEISALNLRTYVGLKNSDKISLRSPEAFIDMYVDTARVVAEAYQNRSDAIGFERRILEAKRDVAKAKGDNGLNATLTARLGFSKSARSFGKVYERPIDQQAIQLEFNIPILDWGRSKSRMKTAQANRQFTEYAVEQDKQNFVQEIYSQVALFDMMKEQLILTAKADSIASEKYGIARERYMLGNLSITDLSIAFQENDQAKQDYVMALRDFWGAYYQLRYLSLYDFEKNEKISYK
jgi:outer membrane protein